MTTAQQAVGSILQDVIAAAVGAALAKCAAKPAAEQSNSSENANAKEPLVDAILPVEGVRYEFKN
eukprot:3499037-Pleurochrysis_carterae.AAC.1